MYYSIRGKIIHLNDKLLVVESNGIGYEVFVSKPRTFNLNDEVFLYVHHHIFEDNEYLAGFSTIEEKNVFKLLLHVTGIGPKSALAILSKTDYQTLFLAISNNDIDFVEHIPGVGSRVASQIMLDLKQYIAKSNKENIHQYKDVKEYLKSMKFKVKDIDRVLSEIYIPNGTDQQIIKEALRRLNYVKNFG